MKEHLHDIEFIERYFDNALSSQETEDLRQRLKKDFEFQKLFEREKVLVHSIRLQAAKKDLEFLKGIERSMEEKKAGRVARFWYYCAAAACVGLIALFIFLPAGKTPEALYAAYFEPHPNVFEPTLRGQQEATVRAQAFQAYDAGNYERAATLFTSLLKDHQEAGALLLLGNANLVLGKTAEAKQNFSDVIAGYDDLDTEAKWYLGLCHLKTGEPSEARVLLRDVASTGTFYAAKAQKLLEDME